MDKWTHKSTHTVEQTKYKGIQAPSTTVNHVIVTVLPTTLVDHLHTTKNIVKCKCITKSLLYRSRNGIVLASCD